MSMIRFITSGILSAIVTAGLILLMHILIQTNIKPPEALPSYNIPEIVMPDVEITTEFDTSKPDRPEEIEEPPPDVPDVEIDTPDVSNDAIVIKPSMDSGIKIASPSGVGGDGEFLPIVKVQANYPSRALSRGIEGYCTVQYTVTTLGTTKDIVIADCPEKVFQRASIKAAAKFKYKPRVIDGEAVEVPGVQNKFTFELAK